MEGKEETFLYGYLYKEMLSGKVLKGNSSILIVKRTRSSPDYLITASQL